MEDDARSGLETLVELAESHPAFFRETITQVCALMFSIATEKKFQSGYPLVKVEIEEH